MAEDNSNDLLDKFLSAAAEITNKAVVKQKPITTNNEDHEFLGKISKLDKGIKEVDEPSKTLGIIKSIVHTGDTDSSEDEDQRDFELRKYNESGRDIRSLLNVPSSSSSCDSPTNSTWKSNCKAVKQVRPAIGKTNKNKNTKKVFEIETNIYTDPIFGLRIVNPLVSSITLQDRMKGRKAIPMARIKQFVGTVSSNDDWVFAGAIVSKMVKTSQKGNQFSIWTVSDLHTDLKSVALFLFSGAHQNLWKTIVGTVIGVLNPSVMEQREKSLDQATVSVNNADRIMILGHSKDLGICRSQKKSGEPCTAFVNKNRCEYCIYHVKAAYQKCSKRSELQSSFAGGGLNALRNKVLGKNEVFYAGKSFSAIKAPTKRSSQKLKAKDNGILEALASNVRVNTDSNVREKNLNKKAASKIDISVSQRKKDLELLQKLTATPTVTPAVSAPPVTFKRISRVVPNDNLKTTKVTPQYDRTFDLFSKLESKCDFDGAISNTVTLADSKNAASGIIAKLKAKKNTESAPKQTIVNKEDKHDEDLDQSLLDDELDEYNYDLDELNTEKSVTQAKCNSPMIMSTSTNDRVLENDIGKAAEDADCSTKEPESMIPTCMSTLSDQLSSKDKDKSPQIQTFKPNKHVTPSITDPIIFNDSTNISESSKISPKMAKSNIVPKVPLSLGRTGKTIDLNTPILKSHITKAKQNAIKYVQRHGPIAKANPMNVKGTKRKASVDTDVSSPSAKKLKEIQENEFMSQRFKRIMAATSRHPELLQKIDDEETDKYFNKMEMKERMEEKMLETFKVNCKAVKCLKCKYTSFSASDRCKAEKHPLKVYDAVKRFFKCKCGNRTVSLNIVPLEGCQKCSNGKWERCAMINERCVKSVTQLSIRGGEERYMGGAVTDANVNLLVPEEGTG